jgi:2,4-dienoyl-CoA reductase-like NADH-dependent reductase (Old Yellow Enzyme family)
MKTETFKGTVGEKLAKEIPFSGTYEAFENYEEVAKANELPSNQEVVDFVNTRRKNNERQTAMTKALAENGYSKPDPNDPIVAAQTMIRNLEKMDNLKAEQKQMMVAVLRQQIADEETKRKAAKAEEPTTVQ